MYEPRIIAHALGFVSCSYRDLEICCQWYTVNQPSYLLWILKISIVFLREDEILLAHDNHRLCRQLMIFIDIFRDMQV